VPPTPPTGHGAAPPLPSGGGSSRSRTSIAPAFPSDPHPVDRAVPPGSPRPQPHRRLLQPPRACCRVGPSGVEEMLRRREDMQFWLKMHPFCMLLLETISRGQ
jgi:hypothetical protein